LIIYSFCFYVSYSQTGNPSDHYDYQIEISKELRKNRNAISSTFYKLADLRKKKPKKRAIRKQIDSLKHRLDSLNSISDSLNVELEKCKKDKMYVKAKNKEYNDLALEKWKEEYKKKKEERLAPYKSDIKILSDIYKLSLQYCDSIDYITKQVYEGGKYKGNHDYVDKKYKLYLDKTKMYIDNYNGFSTQFNIPDKILKEVRLKKKLDYKIDFYCIRE